MRTITPPAIEPVTVAEAADHLRVAPTEPGLAAMITASREAVEDHTRRALITQTRRAVWGIDATEPWFPTQSVPAAIALPRSPVQGVDSVRVWSAGAYVTVAPSLYVVATDREPGLVVSSEWPAADPHPEAVSIQYRCGYGDAAADVPQAIRSAMLMLIGDLWHRRVGSLQRETLGQHYSFAYAAADGGLPMAVRALLAPYRCIELA